MQERIAFVRSSKLCHKCLSSRHRTPDCKRSGTHSKKKCIGQFHHTLLHKPENERKPQPNARDIGTSAADISALATCGLSQNSFHCEVYLCVVSIQVNHHGKVVFTYAFLDQGSTHSFCDKRLIEIPYLKFMGLLK